MRLALFQREAGGFPNTLIPLTSTLVFVLLSVVPLQVTPAFALMAVYHWTIYRAELLPPVAVFLAGLLLDFLNGTQYVGTSALSLLLVRTALLSQRRFFVNRPFPLLWAGFLLTAVIVIAFEWALVSALLRTAVGTRPFIFETVLTVASFPLGSYILTRLQRGFLTRE
jgi:rod shape-determining protein MreD